MYNRILTWIPLRGQTRRWWIAIILAALILLVPQIARADVPFFQSFTAQGRYAIVANGVGLFSQASGDIVLNVPGTPIQAFLYWGGNDVDPGGDDTIDLSINAGPAVSLTADTTYGPEPWFSPWFNYIYVEDVTALVLTGTNTYTVSGFLPIQERYGAGLLVVYEDPALPITDVEIREGLDSAFHGFPSPRGPNTDVTCFQFTISTSARTLDYTLFVGGIVTSTLRPNAIWYQTGSGALPGDLVNQPGATEIGGQPLNSNDGDQWDTYVNSLTVPAGDTFACLQIESISDDPPLNGASFTWLAGGVTITAPTVAPTPTAVPPSGGGGDPAPQLPDTGFAPGRLTQLPIQTSANQYNTIADIGLEIPALGVEIPILGVPKLADGWDVTWLSSQAGYLEGTAFPTRSGNTALTAHVYLSDGTPGPFASLKDLRWGDEVIVQAFGQRHVYEVRRLRYVAPDDSSILDHKDLDWVTLITCGGYDPEQDRYLWRVAVQAVLMRIEEP